MSRSQVLEPNGQDLEVPSQVADSYERLLVGLGACWFLIILSDLYFGRDFIKAISFQVQDPTWMPENVGPSRALVGIHHFGDFQIWLGYAALNNPLASFVKFPPQSPPQLLWFFKSLLRLGFEPLFGIPRVLFGFWLISFGTWFQALKQYFLELHLSKREIRLFAASSVLSAPFIVTFDRGSLQFLVIGTSLLYVHFCNRRRSTFAVILFVIAVSLKPYCAVLLLWPTSQKQYKITIANILAAGTTTVISLWCIPGSIQVAAKSFAKALAGHVTGEGMSFLNDSVSAPASIWKLINILHIEPARRAIEHNSGLLLLGIGIVTCVAAAIIIFSPQTSRQLALIVILACTQLVLPLSGLYTPLWAVAILPLLIRQIEFQIRGKRNLEIMSNLSSSLFSFFGIVSLLPIPGTIHVGDYIFRLTALIAPLGMTLMLFPLAICQAIEWKQRGQ